MQKHIFACAKERWREKNGRDIMKNKKTDFTSECETLLASGLVHPWLRDSAIGNSRRIDSTTSVIGHDIKTIIKDVDINHTRRNEEKQRLFGRRILLLGGEGRLGKRWKEAMQSEGAEVISVDNTVSADITYNIMYSAKNLKKKVGKVDGMVNAAVNNPPPTQEENETDWLNQFDLLYAIRNILVGYGNEWIENNTKASVVLIGSDLALIGPSPDLYYDRHMKPDHYTAVKHATVGIMRHYAMLWAKNNIRVN